MSDKLQMSIDGTTWFDVKSMSMKTDTIGGYTTSVLVDQTISMELDELPFSGAVPFGAHKLLIRQGTFGDEYHAALVACDVTQKLHGVQIVRLTWHVGVGQYGLGAGLYGYSNSGALLSSVLPALHEVMSSPCVCDRRTYFNDMCHVIMHLNDKHQWTRERIADWLDTLDVDLTFPVPDSIPSNIN